MLGAELKQRGSFYLHMRATRQNHVCRRVARSYNLPLTSNPDRGSSDSRGSIYASLSVYAGINTTPPQAVQELFEQQEQQSDKEL